MKIDYRNNLLAQIDTIENFDFLSHAINTNGEQDFMNIRILDEFSIPQLINFIQRSMIQLKNVLLSDEYLTIPTLFRSVELEETITDLSSRIQNLINFSTTPNYEHLAINVKWLVRYERDIGIWDRSEVKIHDADSLKLKEKLTEFDGLIKLLETKIELVNQAKDDLKIEKENLTAFNLQKQQELTTISQSLETVRNQVADVNTNWQNASRLDGEIKTLVESVKNIIDDLKRQINLQQTEFDTIKENASVHIKSVIDNINTTELKLNEFNNEVDEISNRKERVIQNEKKILDLLGMSADAALGGKFNARERKLEQGLKFWTAAVPIMTILALIWVAVVFTCLKANTGNMWSDLGVNLLKTTPIFILLGFVFKQYTKERNLQEEYAFKAAMAMTITVYSDLLKDSDRPDNVTRQNMLLDAVKQVYASPKLYHEGRDRIFSFSTKHLTEAVKNLTEVAKRN